MFNFFKSKPKLSVEILFHKDTNYTEYHGTIFAENRHKKIPPMEIRFAFENMRYAPALTPEVLAYIFDKAREKGYIPSELISYGGNLNRSAAKVISDIQNTTHITAENHKQNNITAMRQGLIDMRAQAAKAATTTKGK